MNFVKATIILFAIVFQSCQADLMARHQEAVKSALKLADFPAPLVKKYACFGKILKFSTPGKDKVFQVEAIVNKVYIVKVLFDIKYSSKKNKIIEISSPREVLILKIRELRDRKGAKPVIYYNASQEVKMTKNQISTTINNNWSFASLAKSESSLSSSKVRSLFEGSSVLLEVPQK